MILRVVRVFSTKTGRAGNPYSLLPPQSIPNQAADQVQRPPRLLKIAASGCRGVASPRTKQSLRRMRRRARTRMGGAFPARSRLIAFVGVGDRLERRFHKRDLAVWREFEAYDVDGLPDLIEDDVLGGQGCDLRVEARDFDTHRDRLRALGELSVGIEVDSDVIMAGRDTPDRRRFLVRLRLRRRAVGERDLRCRIAEAVAIEGRASALAGAVKDWLLLRSDDPKIDVGIELNLPVGGDQKLRLRLDAIDPGLGRRHRDDDHGKNAKEKIGKANPNGRLVSLHHSTSIQEEHGASPA